MNKYVVLIPAYNPTDDLLKIIEELNEKKLSVVVVNDGSDKNYDSIFTKIENKAIVLKHRKNSGKGVALKTGLKYIRDNFKEYTIVTMDADGQHTVSDAIKLCDYASKNKDTLVLGSRILSKTDPIRSRIGHAITRKIFSLFTGTKIYDTQTGLRAFSYDLVDKLLKINGNRYEYEMNMLLTFSKEGIPIKELKIKTIYIDNNSSSHFKAFKDSYRIYKVILKHIINTNI